ncbi:lipopolysaccharide heptosyltransferase I [Ramlibacter algicola]|uniref:Lipopolysaccharide heptosyltransferase 1 n=1 Tax=Ramlibacter algicola TaxID=2795217 RepID=A0A934UR89_9BURK|nr:lipopolysaccharide heptosyltransferase I [Ramlibacter algicola]
MRVLIVKLSSLGDVVHAMPAVQDVLACVPGVQVDWVVERAFAPLVERCEGVSLVIPCELRRWARSPLAAETRAEWRTFRKALRATRYDAVLDLQGLTKSALVARAARTSESGRRFALGNRTDGAGWEAPTRWVADVAVPITPRTDAVTRSRLLCAAAFDYGMPSPLRFGLRAAPTSRRAAEVAFVHGTSREDKCWPQEHWIALGRCLVEQGHAIGLPHGSDAELARSEAIAAAIGPAAQVWPRMDLGALTDRLAACAGVIGVDSGLSHIAVALDLPHVQVYNFDTAWRTGPSAPHQRSVYAQPAPSLDAVWNAWLAVRGAA